MEFFSEIENVDLASAELKKLLAIDSLPGLCRSISTVVSDERDRGDIYCVWGEFEVRRDEIRYGVRFSLPGCPNALAWTITVHEESRLVVVHCTIDRKEHDEDFVESIHEFVADWSDGIRTALRGNVATCSGKNK